MQKKYKIALLATLDGISVALIYLFAIFLRFDFSFWNEQASQYLDVCYHCLVPIIFIKLTAFALMGLYNSLWRYASLDELVKVIGGALVANFAAIAFLVLSSHLLPRSVYFIVTVLDIAALGLIRLAYRYFRHRRAYGRIRLLGKGNCKSFWHFLRNRSGFNGKRLMLVGAGDAGAEIIKEVRMYAGYSRRVVVAVDDDRQKRNQMLYNVKIAGNRYDIPALVEKYEVDEIIVAIPSLGRKELGKILEECNKTGCKVKILPALIDIISEKVSMKALRDVDIADLLGRETVELNTKDISEYLEGKTILVTGAAGSIGSELCRQISKYGPKKLLCIDIHENGLYELNQEFVMYFPQIDLLPFLASIRDPLRIDDIFHRYHPDIVFHAAAHKHVPLMEHNPKDAIVNNALGTKIMLDAAEKYGVKRFVLISTDKAVNPTNVMGATKRIGEMLLQEKSTYARTNFAAVRFGNVLGSNGSVIPMFRRQIAKGGPVTVTHKSITRYFMTIPEAVRLVIQAGAMAKGGEIFILDMGEPVKIMDLAEKVIRLSGYEPYVDIDIEVTGLRPGEKLYEELLLSEEGIKETPHEKIFVGQPVPISPALEDMLRTENGFADTVNMLREMTEKQAKAWLKRVVPNYTETPNGKGGYDE